MDDKTNTTQKTNKHCQCRNTDSGWMIKQTLHRKLINIVSVEILTQGCSVCFIIHTELVFRH
jgi:hypothetical protein